MLMTGSGRTARVHYLPGTFRLLSDGDHVICAVTGARIPLHELRYWSGSAWTDHVFDAGRAGIDCLGPPSDAAAAGDRPIRQDAAFLHSGTRSMQRGMLLLFPDRIVHVSSNLMNVAFLGGALGAGIAYLVTKQRAPGRAARGGTGVLEIPLNQITGVSRGKRGRNRNVLVISTAGGADVSFGVKYDRWAAELGRLLGPDVLNRSALNPA